MAFFSLFVVLAITYNQGEARPANDNFGYVTKNDLAGSEGFQMNSDDGTVFTIPTNIRKGVIITINGTIKTDDKSFTVVLPSLSANQNCQIKYNFENETIDITPAVEGYKTTTYNLNFSSGEAPTFALRLIARINLQGQEILSMTFNGNDDGESEQLICKIQSFEDINRIVMEEGVAHVHSLLFEFGENR